MWKKVPGTEAEIPEPQYGLDENFDRANEAVNVVKEQLSDYLAQVRAQFKCNSQINFSHAKFRYELEIPTELVKGSRRPDDFELTSQKKGYERFHTPQIKALIEGLEVAE